MKILMAREVFVKLSNIKLTLKSVYPFSSWFLSTVEDSHHLDHINSAWAHIISPSTHIIRLIGNETVGLNKKWTDTYHKLRNNYVKLTSLTETRLKTNVIYG
jgi:hypothetical protein